MRVAPLAHQGEALGDGLGAAARESGVSEGMTAEEDVLEDRHEREEAALLWDVDHAGLEYAARGETAERAAREGDRSSLRAQQAAHGPQHGGLSGTVGTDQAGNGPGLELEVHATQDVALPVAGHQILDRHRPAHAPR